MVWREEGGSVMVAFVGCVGRGSLKRSRAPVNNAAAAARVETVAASVERLSGLRKVLNSPVQVTTKVEHGVDRALEALAARGVKGLRIGRALSVARVLREMRADESTVVAGMLRGMPLTESAILQKFGQDTYDIWRRDMELCTLAEAAPLTAAKFSHLALLADIPCLVIELAHSVSTLRLLEPGECSAEKAGLSQERLKQILRVHVPLADTLGLWAIQSELEELAFMHLHPQAHTKMCELVGERLQAYGPLLGETIRELERILSNLPQFNKVASFRVSGRIKNCYSIFRKMKVKQLKFEEVLDFVALRVILEPRKGVSEKHACDIVMREVQRRWDVDWTKDYITNPKENGYQSLHSAVRINGLPMEIQVRTERMHMCSEIGSASHPIYKIENNALLM